jgi:NAD(P)-dependent dehydrogenase (short-subunit alcohol dehydrogenase family)
MTSAGLSNRTALVTGAGRGIGRAVALELATRGARVVVNDLRDELLVETLQQVGSEAGPAEHAEPFAVAGNVTDPVDVTMLFRQIEAETDGGPDILVNCAGALRGTKFADIDEPEWDLVVGVNLKGTFLMSQAAIVPMRRRGWGRIVNLSSTAGKNVSTLGGAHYTAAKAGVLGLTRHLASETAADGITVNAVCPGLIDTAMVRESVDADRIAAYERSFPISRLGTAQEVASLTGFLCSDEAAYITGASMDINGGDLMI